MTKSQKKLTKARLLFNEKQLKKASQILSQLNDLTQDELYQKKVLEAAILVRSQEVDLALKKVDEAELIAKGETEATLNIKAIAYRAKNELLKAKSALEEGIKKYPNSVDLAHNLSVTAADLGDLKLAEKAGLKALEINPNYIETYKNLGRVYITERDTNKAKKLFQKLDKLTPNSVDVLVGYGAIELIHSRAEKAKEFFEKALEKDDSLNAAWANLGLCHKFLGDFHSARQCLITATQKDPNQIEHVWNLALINLALGEFREGWEQYEVRYNPKRIAPDAVKLPTTSLPMLRKVDSVRDKIVLLVQEQGYGDTFQFFRFAKNLKAEGARKIIAIVSVETIDIIRTVPWIDEVRTEIKNSEIVPDYWVFSMSLPARYQINSVAHIPAYSHYLSVEEDKVHQWAVALGNSPKIRVGIVWAGRETHTNDANRSLTVGLLEPIFELHNEIEFISLQKGRRELDIQEDRRINSCGQALQNFADTAGLLSNLDLLISVDSAPVHLAGALGMPVWTLIPSIHDFRWLNNREDSPWYPTMKLYRQKIGQTWDEVVTRLKYDLQALVKNRPVRWQADQYHLFPTLGVKQSNLAGNTLFINSAFQYHLSGNLKIAELMYVKALRYDQSSLDAIRNLAALYRSVGDLNKSETIYRYGENKGISDPIFFTNYANLLMDLRRFDEARMKADIALTINPMHVPAREVKQRLAQLSQNVG